MYDLQYRCRYPLLPLFELLPLRTLWGYASSFHLPDLRGRFLRGLDGTAGNDTDKAARTAMNAGGSTGNTIVSATTAAGPRTRRQRRGLDTLTDAGGKTAGQLVGLTGFAEAIRRVRAGHVDVGTCSAGIGDVDRRAIGRQQVAHRLAVNIGA